MKSMAVIVAEVEKETGVGMYEMAGRSKERRIVLARREVAIRASQQGYSFRDIGMFLGGRTSGTMSRLAKRKFGKEKKGEAGNDK